MQCIYVLYNSQNKSDYFPNSINHLGFVMEKQCAANDAWTELLHVIWKIFMINRIRYKKYLSRQNMGNIVNDTPLLKQLQLSD
jgi:hypothetical protein